MRDVAKGDAPDLAGLAALIGDPARARMLTAVMSGAALTATELALGRRGRRRGLTLLTLRPSLLTLRPSS